MSNGDYTVERTERTWMSKKEYIICKKGKEVLKLSDRDEADKVCKYLNKVTKKSGSRKKVKKVVDKTG